MSGETVAGRDGDGGSEIRLERKVETAGGGGGTCGEINGVQEVDLKVGSGYRRQRSVWRRPDWGGDGGGEGGSGGHRCG